MRIRPQRTEIKQRTAGAIDNTRFKPPRSAGDLQFEKRPRRARLASSLVEYFPPADSEVCSSLADHRRLRVSPSNTVEILRFFGAAASSARTSRCPPLCIAKAFCEPYRNR